MHLDKRLSSQKEEENFSFSNESDQPLVEDSTMQTVM